MAPLCIIIFRYNDSLTTVIGKYRVTFQYTEVLCQTAQDHEGPTAHNVVSIALLACVHGGSMCIFQPK